MTYGVTFVDDEASALRVAPQMPLQFKCKSEIGVWCTITYLTTSNMNKNNSTYSTLVIAP